MSRPDFLIVGGGIIGMLTARELSQTGATVALVERGSTGRESSWAGGGILSPLHPWRYPDPVTRLAQWSQAQYPFLASELYKATGIDPELTPSGLLILGANDHDWAFRWADQFGYQFVEVTPGEAREIEPQIAAPSAAALWIKEVCQIRNPRLTKALRQDLKQRDVTFHEHREVTGFFHEKGQAEGVNTAEGPLRADCVIVATGAWTAKLLTGLGHCPEIEPVRGQMLLFHTESKLIARIILSHERYLIPRRDGRVLVGSTQERVGFEKAVTNAAFKLLRTQALELVPQLARYSVEHHWAGLRPGSPNGVPYIGEHPEVRGLYINAGHFRNGLVLAPGSTRLLADLILDRKPILDPKPYALNTPRR